IKDGKGGIAPLLALAAIPIMGAIATSVDYSRASSAHSAMQAALDSTALMMAKNAQSLSGANLNTAATNYFNATFSRPEVQNLQITATASVANGGVSMAVMATGSIQ